MLCWLGENINGVIWGWSMFIGCCGGVFIMIGWFCKILGDGVFIGGDCGRLLGNNCGDFLLDIWDILLVLWKLGGGFIFLEWLDCIDEEVCICGVVDVLVKFFFFEFGKIVVGMMFFELFIFLFLLFFLFLILEM